MEFYEGLDGSQAFHSNICKKFFYFFVAIFLWLLSQAKVADPANKVLTWIILIGVLAVVFLVLPQLGIPLR